VKAQEHFSGLTNYATAVAKSWIEFKGGSECGLALLPDEDEKGVVRIVLHPRCSTRSSPAELPTIPIDLEAQRT